MLLPARTDDVQQARRHDCDILVRAEERLSHEQVVPDPQELEDREGREGRRRQRQDEPGERLEVRGAVDVGGLEDVLRELAHVVVQQVGGQRESEACMRQPDGQERAVQVDRQVRPQDRDQRDLERHDEQGHDRDEQDPPAREVHPGEPVGGEGGDEDRDDHRRDRHGQRVEEGVAESVPTEDDLLVVVQRECALRVREDRPPA